MKKFNVVMVAGHACVRVQKMALPLIENGHKVHLIARKIPVFVEQYHSYSMAHDAGQYIELIKLYSKIADVFHCHNEPSWFVTMIKEVCDVPVILDVHDSFLARTTPEEQDADIENGIRHIRITNEERNNFQLADALVFPCEALKDIVMNEFRLTQPFLVLPSYLPKRIYNYASEEWLGGLVYEGRVDLKTEIEKHPAEKGFRYTDYEDLANQAKDMGMDFHIYARGDKPYLDIFEKIAYTHAPQNYDKLIGRLSRHDWGLVGNSFYTPEWDIALPNKLFEYIAAGVPVVAINARHSADFIKEYGVGIEVQSLKELAERWPEHTGIRKKLLRVRQKFAMENHIDKLEALYDQVIKTVNWIPGEVLCSR